MPGTEITNSDAQVTLVEYSGGVYDDATMDVTVHVPAGVTEAYINIHLDYGLKGSTAYSKDTSNNAVSVFSPSTIFIPNLHNYVFSDSEGGSTTIQNFNVFKHDPGFAGMVLDASGNAVSGVMVKIYKPDRKVLATVYTDEDGWYMYQYKHTGKAMIYSIELPGYNQIKTVSLKSNQLVTVDFQIN